MNFQIPAWAISVGILTALGAFFFFCMNGYTYITYSLLFVAALILVHQFGSVGFRRAVAVVTCLGLMYFCTLEIMIVSSSFGDRGEKRDYIVILGAEVKGQEPSIALRHRLEGALRYLEENPETVAVCSGGTGDGDEISEALCMANWLMARGIAPERILQEDRSTSTMENLTFSFETIREHGGEPDGNVAIVSSGYHLCRAKAMAKMLGCEAIGVPGSLGYPIFTLGCFIREAFGLTHLWVFGR